MCVSYPPHFTDEGQPERANIVPPDLDDLARGEREGFIAQVRVAERAENSTAQRALCGGGG